MTLIATQQLGASDFFYALLLGIAVASGFKLVAVDRVTQALRYRVLRRLDKAGGFIPYHLQYLIGCALCAPVWIASALFFTRQFKVTQWITVILAGRFIAYCFLRWLNETGLRDWPVRKETTQGGPLGSEIEWPPAK